LVLQIFFQCPMGNTAKAVMSSAASEHVLDLGELAAEQVGNDAELLADLPGGGLGEDGADGGGDHLGGALGDLGQDVTQEAKP
jgi:hypothetical protein